MHGLDGAHPLLLAVVLGDFCLDAELKEALFLVALPARTGMRPLTEGYGFPIGGLRTPAPVCAAPPSWGRHPQTFTKKATSTPVIRPLGRANLGSAIQHIRKYSVLVR